MSYYCVKCGDVDSENICECLGKGHTVTYQRPQTLPSQDTYPE